MRSSLDCSVVIRVPCLSFTSAITPTSHGRLFRCRLARARLLLRFTHLRCSPARAVAQQATFEEFDDLLDDQYEDHERRRPREHAVHPEELLFHSELVAHA